MEFSAKTFFITVIPVFLNLVFGAMVVYSNLGNYNKTRKAPFTPPSWIFSVIWVVMYGLIATAGYLGYQYQPNSKYQYNFLIAFYAQVLLNFAWILCFFGARLPRLALVVLMALISVVVYMAYETWTYNVTASSFFIVYAVWLLFATFLNVGYVVVNQL